MTLSLSRIYVRARITAFSAAAVFAVPAATAQSNSASKQQPTADNTSVVRCQPLSGDYKAACEIRIAGFRGAGGTSGTSGSATDSGPGEVKIIVRPVEPDRTGAQPKAASPAVPASEPAAK